MKSPRIGHNIFQRHYRVRSKKLAQIIFITDLIGNAIFTPKRKKQQSPKNILVIRLEHIGDIVLTSVFTRNLRKNYPKSKITILCRSNTYVVANMLSDVDQIITLNTPWSTRGEKLTSLNEIIIFLRKNYKKFDLAFDLAFDPRNIVLAKILSKFTIGFGVRGAGFLLNKEVKWSQKTKHIVSRQLDLLRSINLTTTEQNIKLELNNSKLQNFRKKHKLPKKYILVQISAGSKYREWNLNNWIKLINILVKNNKVVCAEQNTRIVEELKQKIKSKNLIFKNLNLEEYIYLIHDSEKVISVESSAIHIGSNFNKKVVDIHSGQTLPEEWGPYKNSKSTVITPHCGNKSYGLNNCNATSTNHCMNSIKSKEVLNAAIG